MGDCRECEYYLWCNAFRDSNVCSECKHKNSELCDECGSNEECEFELNKN